MIVWLKKQLGGVSALLGIPALLLGQASATAVKNPEVVQLTITGVHAVNQGDLLQSLAIEQSRCRGMILIPVCWLSKSPTFYQHAYLNHTELARDVIRARVYYYQRGYRETTVDTVVQTVGKGKVHVTLAVHEGAPTIVDSVQVVQKETLLTRHDLRNDIHVRVGQPLNQFDVDSTRMQLRDRLWEKGHSDAIIDTSTTIDTVGHRAAVTMTITPRWVSHVGTISVRGNDKVSTPTILKSLSLKPGDVYRRSDVVESQRALYQSNLFRLASIGVVRQRGAPVDSIKPLMVSVQEAPPRTARLSAGFNTVDFAQVEAGYTDYNWYGGGRQLNLLLTVGNLFARQLNGNGIFYDISKTVIGAGEGKYYLPSFDASGAVKQPWFGSPDNDVAISLFTHRRISPGIYVDRGYGTGLTFTRHIGIQTTASIGYRFEVTNVDAGDLYFCVSAGVCDAPTLAALHKNQTLSPIALSLAADHTDDPYEPRKGYKARLDLEHASSYTLSDFRYNRATNEEWGYLPVGRHSVLAGHFEVGYVSALASTAQAVGADSLSGDGGILHPRKRFYLGGAASVRGFAENQLGPRVLTISQAVLRGNPANSSENACGIPIPITQCNPNASYIRDSDFQPRALGGNQLLEANVEYRFPVFGSFLGAVFVDAGYLGQNTDTTLARYQAAVTPGFGVRYLSPAGPIRVDIGINPETKPPNLPVVTENYENGTTTLVTLQERRTYHPVTGFLSRLMLHLAIGEAY